MSGIDQLLALSLEKTIKENLGEITIHKIQDRLFEKYGISITQSFQEFEKLDYVLREFFGGGADGLEAKFLEKICSKTKGKSFKISEPAITQSILNAFNDEDSSNILNSTSKDPLTLLEILEKCNIPQASGYRKANSLIDSGLLVREGNAIMPSGKKVPTYKSLFDTVKIDIKKGKVTIGVEFADDVLVQSTILQTVYS